MYLETLTINGYKSITEAELNFSSLLNCFVGENGSGKTNILDAIHFLSLTKSAAALPDKGCVKHGEKYFILRGSYENFSKDKSQSITASYQIGGRKKIMLSGKEYSKLSDHIGRFPLVMVSPGDVELIADAASVRRAFMNTFFSQIDSEYLALMIRYNAILAQRNIMLKDPTSDSVVLEIVSEQLSEIGQRIFSLRSAHIDELSPIVADFYNKISGKREEIAVNYISQLTEKPLSELLRENLSRDLAIGHTSAGIHRDDISLKMNDYPIRSIGSQGQQKSLLLALKLAEAKIIAQKRGVKALLLLDDVFDKLDMERVENLVKLVAGEDFGQIFITDANKVRLEGIVEKFDTNYKMFELHRGEATQLK